MNRLTMSMRGVSELILAVTAMAVLSGGPVSAGISFTDGFEAATLDPFWSTRQDSGSVSVSGTQVHAGTQALQLSSTSGTGEKYIWVFHTFDQPVFGDVSVWMYDTGADEGSSNYLGLELSNSVDGQHAALYTRDYDLGTPAAGGDYRWNCNDASGYSVDRTKEWHHFTISSTPEQIVLAIDGQVVRSAAGGTPFDRVQLRMEGPTWRPAWVCYYDDFSFEEYTATVPTVPIADAGVDLVINSADQSLTTLQGTASDPDGDALQYRWLEAGVELTTWAGVVDGMAPLSLGAVPTFSLGEHVLVLEVTDGTLTGNNAMTLTLLNTPPVAVLNPASLTVEIASSFTIKATAADFDGDILAYQWIKGSEVLASGNIDTPDDASPIAVPDLMIGLARPSAATKGGSNVGSRSAAATACGKNMPGVIVSVV
jgi:hypothetical protein